jgi:hypothetical protein
MRPEVLEERIALSTIAVSGVHYRPLHATPATVNLLNTAVAKISPPNATGSVATLREGRGFNLADASSVTVGSNGDVTVTTADGAKVYQKVENGWMMIAWNHQTPQGWVEESWGAGGSYQEVVWISNLHLPLNKLSQTVIANGVMTITLFHQNDFDAYGYNALGWYLDYVTKAQDATVTWTYKLHGDLNNRELVEYHLVNGKGQQYTANAWWAKNPPSTPYFDPAYHGWFESFPGRNDIPPPQVPRSAVAMLHPHVEIAKEPPGATVETQSQGGDRIETVWNTGRTQSISFVYGGPSQATLLEQTYGRMAGGKWVTTTDHSQRFITQTATYDKPGGNLETSVTELKAANGQTVTFNGKWESGTAVSNATGIETASNYLGFSSVTVQYEKGKPVKRYGLLDSYLGGLYATDTFNDAGTAVVKREISNSQGGPVVQTWTGSDTHLTISRANPAPNISQDKSQFVWNDPHTGK